MKNPLCFVLSLCFIFLFNGISAQDTTNTGQEFWVGYGHHQFMESGSNSQNMTLYIATGAQPANVVIRVHGTGDVRMFVIPANTVKDIETGSGPIGPIPKTGSFDARLFSPAPPAGSGSSGLFTNKAVQVVSDVPVVVYAHIYGSTSSGATMLLPVESWGGLYVSSNSKQSYASNSFSWMYVIAKYDNTLIEITPAVKTRAQNLTGLQPGVVKTITLMKGQIYQVMGANLLSDADGNGGTSPDGYELTGTKVRSITSPTGYIHPIAVFSGSSRTSNPSACGSGGGDNDMQQHFPRQALGKIYLTTPFSGSTTPSSFSTSKFKVLVFDPTTVVTRNGTVLTGLQPNNFYEFESNTPDRIESDQPILVTQFMTGGSCSAGGSLGDPDMVYLSPLSQGVNSARFYRNTKENITVNYLSIIVPTTAVASTTIDGSNIFDHTLIHPQDPTYTILVKRWTASQAQAFVQSTGAFVGTTYGLGSVESYAYNVGTKTNAVNARDASVLPPGFTGVLPVTLTDFNATKNGDDVLLKWNSSHEINFDRFEVERSLDGREFSKFITTFPKSSGIYDAVDMSAVKIYGAHAIFYRLKMIDKDGKFNYSSIVSIKNEKLESLQISVMPNPFVDKINIQVQSETFGIAKINIRDITGKLLESRSKYLAAGNTSIEINSLNNLQKGIYIIDIEMNGIKQYVKAVKN